MEKAIIFDLDGTLLNTLNDLKTSTNYALKKFGFQERSLEEIRKFVGNGLKMLICRAVPEGTDEDVITAVLAQMKAHYDLHAYDTTRPYDGISALLAALQAEGRPMAIVSNKANGPLQVLHQRFFAPYIPVAVGELDGVPRKPAPDLVWLALERLGVAPEDACYVGDSEVDLLTAKNAGLPCYIVGWGFRTEEELRAVGAEKIYASPAELKEALLV